MGLKFTTKVSVILLVGALVVYMVISGVFNNFGRPNISIDTDGGKIVKIQPWPAVWKDTVVYRTYIYKGFTRESIHVLKASTPRSNFYMSKMVGGPIDFVVLEDWERSGQNELLTFYSGPWMEKSRQEQYEAFYLKIRKDLEKAGVI
jgi:hypothetical protein